MHNISREWNLDHMPALYCRPANALANRLMGLSSCIRLARLWNREFVLVWEYGYGSFFSSPWEDLFSAKFASISNDLPPGVRVRTVRRLELPGDRNYLIQPSDSEDVYIDGWRHFCLDADDTDQSASAITNEIREEYVNTVAVSHKVQDIFQSFGGSFDIEYDLGVHIRKGALEWIGIGDICTTAQIVQFYNLLANHLGPDTTYITGTSPKDNLEFLLGIQGIAQHSRVSPAMSFEPSLLNHALAIGDFYQLSRCKSILKMGHTTYSSLAGIIGRSKLFTIVSNTQLVEQRAEVLSGMGL